MPCPSRKRSSPRFDITVATIPGLARRPSSFQLCAITASSWSPSTRCPRSSTRMTRSASPSSAMPMSARISRTLRLSASGEVEPHSLLMLNPSGSTPIEIDIGAQLPQRFRHHLVGGAVGAIDHHAQAVEAEIARQRALGEFDVAVMDAVDAAGAAETGALRQFLVERFVEQLLDLLFDVVGELEALRAEQLDAVVLEQIVGGGNHHAEIGAHRLGQHRHRRRRHRAEQQHVHADRGESGHHRVFDHIAGKTRILADDDAMAMLATLKHQSGRLPDLERQLRRDQTIGTAPNPVRTEIFAVHISPSSYQGFSTRPARSLERPPSWRAEVIMLSALKWLQKI